MLPKPLAALTFIPSSETTLRCHHFIGQQKDLEPIAFVPVLIDQRAYAQGPVMTAHRGIMPSAPTFNIIHRKDRAEPIITGFDSLLTAIDMPTPTALMNYNRLTYGFRPFAHTSVEPRINDAKMRRLGLAMANGVYTQLTGSPLYVSVKEKLPHHVVTIQRIQSIYDRLDQPFNYAYEPVPLDILLPAHKMHNLRLFGQACLHRFLRCYTVQQQNIEGDTILSHDEATFRILFNQIVTGFFLDLSMANDLTGEYDNYRTTIFNLQKEAESSFDPTDWPALDTVGTHMNPRIKALIDSRDQGLIDETSAFVHTAWDEAGTFALLGFTPHITTLSRCHERVWDLPPLFYGHISVRGNYTPLIVNDPFATPEPEYVAPPTSDVDDATIREVRAAMGMDDDLPEPPEDMAWMPERH